MTLRKILLALAKTVADQAEQDPAFATRIATALGIADQPATRRAPAKRQPRAAAALDPVKLARNGETALRTELALLSPEQLRKIAANDEIDPEKKARRWKKADRLIEHIVTMALLHARKGDAFRLT